MILIDTNIFVDFLRNFPPALQLFSSFAGREDVVFSAITETELITGTANKDPKIREILVHFLRRWTKISLGNPVAAFAGDLCRDYGLSIPDAIIAATALAHDAELITRNVKDFQRVPELKIRAPY